MSLSERISEVKTRLQAACQRSGRTPTTVSLIAVTKYVPLETVEHVLQEGLSQIGENRWQDAQEKWETIGSRATWHFIGHLQTNKVRDVIGKFDYIHSLDRLSLAEEIQKKAMTLGIQVKCFIQLNVSGEESKYGLAPNELDNFAKSICGMSQLKIVGLMTMAPHSEDADLIRSVFRQLRMERDRLNEQRIFAYDIPHLSMGMSNDYEIAIEEGATWIRLGSVLVGK